MLVLLAVVGFQPIRGADFWWQLSRGSVVVGGAFDPSRTLLAMEDQAEADWLGGLPLYLFYQTMGGHAVMAARILLLCCFLNWLVGPCRQKFGREDGEDFNTPSWRLSRPLIWLVVTVLLIGLVDDINMMPRMLDCIFIACLAWLQFRFNRQSNSLSPGATTVDRGTVLGWKSGRTAMTAFALFVLWSNTTSGIFAGLIGWFTFGANSDQIVASSRWKHFRDQWTVAGLILVGGMINPRGASAWLDSLSAIVPSWRNSAFRLLDTPWQPLRLCWTEPSSLAFIGLTVIWCVHRTQNFRRLPSNIGCFAWFQFLAWSCFQNVSLASAWLAADVLIACHLNGEWFVDKQLKSRSHRLSVLAGPICAVAALSIGSLKSTMGWGIDASLDNRLLHLALDPCRPYGTALSDTTRSGGMLAWESLRYLDRSSSGNFFKLQLQDLPIRSVVAGRFEENQRVLDDLRQQRLMSYHRTDGSSGGYWVPLAGRETTLLAISQCDTEMIRALEPSIWKPLSLDSPVIPYASAGDAAYAKRMIEILSDREIVEFQSWQYEFPIPTGSIFDRDWLGTRSVIKNDEQLGRQASVFRAMGLHYAALRVLFVGVQEFPNHASLHCEIGQCQTELANEEMIDAGQASLFRRLASDRVQAADLCGDPFVDNAALKNTMSIQWDRSQNRHGDVQRSKNSNVERELSLRVKKYLLHGPTELIAKGDFEIDGESIDSQLMYAGLCGAIEAGRPQDANRYLDWLENYATDSAIQKLTQVRRSEINPTSVKDQSSGP